MNKSIPLKDLVPNYYTDIREMARLITINDSLIGTAHAELTKFYSDMYIQTATVTAVEEHERELQIVASPSTESLDFRRRRIINRLQMVPPFTLPYLRRQLDIMIGAGLHNTYMDYEKYTLYVEAIATNQSWFKETLIFINKIKPCNVVFVNKPYTRTMIEVATGIEKLNYRYAYILGSWNLGATPFVQYTNTEVLKSMDEKGVSDIFLTDLATFSVNDVVKITLNRGLDITDFSGKIVTGSHSVVQVEVTPEMISEVNLIEAKNKNGDVIQAKEVYIPILQPSILQVSFDFVERGI